MKITTKQAIKRIIDIFYKETGCCIQYNNCPCNTDFHNMGNNKTDWNHILWLVILAIRGDYLEEEDFNNLINKIEMEL